MQSQLARICTIRLGRFTYMAWPIPDSVIATSFRMAHFNRDFRFQSVFHQNSLIIILNWKARKRSVAR